MSRHGLGILYKKLSRLGPKSVVGGATGTFFLLTTKIAHKSSDVPRTAALLLLRHRLLDGHMLHGVLCVPVQVRRQTDEALARNRNIRSEKVCTPFSVARRMMTNLDHGITPSVRVRAEGAMHGGRCRHKYGTYDAPQRARARFSKRACSARDAK